MEYKIPIPDCYVWMTEGYANRGRLFKKYVQGYLYKTYPDMKLIRIEGMNAICVKK